MSTINPAREANIYNLGFKNDSAALAFALKADGSDGTPKNKRLSLNEIDEFVTSTPRVNRKLVGQARDAVVRNLERKDEASTYKKAALVTVGVTAGLTAVAALAGGPVAVALGVGTAAIGLITAGIFGLVWDSNKE